MAAKTKTKHEPKQVSQLKWTKGCELCTVAIDLVSSLYIDLAFLTSLRRNKFFWPCFITKAVSTFTDLEQEGPLHVLKFDPNESLKDFPCPRALGSSNCPEFVVNASQMNLSSLRQKVLDASISAIATY